MNPWAVTGLTDAEGYFGFTISKKSGRKLAFELKPRFSFHMHSRDYNLLVNLKEFFGVGNVSLKAKSSYYSVGSKEDIAIIIQHFKLFPLQTSKRNSFYIFSIVFDMFCKKEHLSVEGFMKAVSYINSLNKPLEPETLKSVTDIYGKLPLLTLPPVIKYCSIAIPSPWWIVGFICGDGSFSYVKIARKETNKLFFYFNMSISQLKMDKYVLQSISNFLGAGTVYEYGDRKQAELVVRNIKVIQHILLPFFLLYPMMGYKRTQYNIWLKAVLLTLGTTEYSKERENQLLALITNLSELNGYTRELKVLNEVKNLSNKDGKAILAPVQIDDKEEV